MIDRLMGYVIINYGKTIRFRVILTSPFIFNNPSPPEKTAPTLDLENWMIFAQTKSSSVNLTMLNSILMPGGIPDALQVL